MQMCVIMNNCCFYPRDAMLAQVLAKPKALCLCPSVSVTSRCSIERGARIDLVFGMEASFDQYEILVGLSRK